MTLRYNAPLVLTFALLCAAVFGLNWMTGGALAPWTTLDGYFRVAGPQDVVTWVTYPLGHASLDHLVGNMMFLLLLGPTVEQRYGSSRLFWMMLATVLATAFFQKLFFDDGLLGASGIVFMLILLAPFTNVDRGEIPISFILVAILFVGKEIIDSQKADRVSQFGHIMGAVAGAAFAFHGSSRKGGRAKGQG